MPKKDEEQSGVVMWMLGMSAVAVGVMLGGLLSTATTALVEKISPTDVSNGSTLDSQEIPTG